MKSTLQLIDGFIIIILACIALYKIFQSEKKSQIIKIQKTKISELEDLVLTLKKPMDITVSEAEIVSNNGEKCNHKWVESYLQTTRVKTCLECGLRTSLEQHFE